MFIKLETSLIPVSRNNLDKLHWAARGRIAKQWALEIMAAKSQAGIFGRPELDRCKINIQILHVGRGILDEDNAWAGLKYLFDALVKNGLILDDSDEIITERTLIRTRVDHQSQQKTVIVITELTQKPA